MRHVYTSLYIGGQWRQPSGAATLTAISAATEEPIGKAPACTTSDVDAAVAAAQRALTMSEWATWTPARRADAMDRLADALDNRIETIAELASSEIGQPLWLSALGEATVPAKLLRYYAGLARHMEVEERRPALSGNGVTLIRREPAGVVAALVPWNFPSSLTGFKLAPALAAGCTIVLKPAPETTLDAFLLADAAHEAGLPPGVLNVVSGGTDIGEYLVSHPGVDKVAFTGSTAAGRKIGEVCGRLLRRCTLELGGKSAAIVLDDADLAHVAENLTFNSLLNSGQTCFLSTRILAPRNRYTEVLDTVTSVAASLKIGDPFDDETIIGPLVSSRQRERVESYIAAGIESGARLTTGGKRPSHLDKGWYVSPTVFGDVSNSSRIAREEIFGPVLAVIPYDGVDHAVALANDSDYGLGGVVWTTDQERGLDVARRVRTGSIGVNFYELDYSAPFGGMKASGIGRELGPEAIGTFSETKAIYLPNS